MLTNDQKHLLVPFRTYMTRHIPAIILFYISDNIQFTSVMDQYYYTIFAIYAASLFNYKAI